MLKSCCRFVSSNLFSCSTVKSSILPRATPPIALGQPKAIVSNRFGRWFLVAWLGAMMDGRLFLAIAVSLLTYHHLTSGPLLSAKQWQQLNQRLRRQLARIGQSPWLASTLAFASTYGFATAWSQLGGGWTVLTLSALGVGNGLFLLRDMESQPQQRLSSKPDTRMASQPAHHWDDLSSPDPLKRLLAVRSLTHQCSTLERVATAKMPGTQVTMRSHLIDCLQIRLRHEPEPRVRAAILAGLRSLNLQAQLPPGQPPISPLESPAQSTPLSMHRVVEYVEP